MEQVFAYIAAHWMEGAIWLLGKVQDLKFAIQDLVYG
jgi:hypothetical protein